MTIAKGTKPRKAKREDKPSPSQSDTANAASPVIWDEDMGTGRTAYSRNRLRAPVMLREGQTEAARSFDASLEYFLEFMSLCDAKEAIEDLPVRHIPTGTIELPYDEKSRFAGRTIPEREVIRNDYLLTALLADDKSVAFKGRRFLPLAGQKELDVAAPIVRHLSQAISGVLDDFVAVREWNEQRRTNMTLHALRHGKKGDGKALIGLHSEIAELSSMNDSSRRMWTNARMNIAWLWNWMLEHETNEDAIFPFFDPLRKKFVAKKLKPIDLYNEPPSFSSCKLPAPNGVLVGQEGKEFRYSPRWELLPMLCQWCARPVMMRSRDNKLNSPSITCSEACKKAWDNILTRWELKDNDKLRHSIKP